MKKFLPISFLLFVSLNTFAVNPTQGPLQQNPSLCSYGYNPNCGQISPPPKKIINHTIVLPSKYGAIASDKKTGIVGSSHSFDSQAAAEEAAIQSCQNGNRKLSCKIVAFYGNGCISAVGGSIAKKAILFPATDENPGGYAAKKALDKCQKSGASDCYILIQEECSRS